MNIIAYTKTWLWIGLVIVTLSLGIVGVFGLSLGIDFTGGALTEVSYDTRPSKVELEEALDTRGLGGYSLRETTNNDGRPGYILRTRDLSEAERQDIESALLQFDQTGEVVRFTSIGPVIGEELKRKAVWAVSGVVLVIILYVAFAFRGVRTPVGSFVYGGITIAALIHDVLVPTAFMSILGMWFGVEIDVLFVMAILAVLGYSVNDTIVVFDRVRENLAKYRQEKKVFVKNEFGQKEEQIEYIYTKPFPEVVNESLGQSLLRSINTSVTTFVALLALYLFGGEVTQTFALVLMVGVLAGAYSSIFLASPLLVWWSNRTQK